MNIAKFLTAFFIEHLRCLRLDLFLACGSGRLEVFCKKGVLRNFSKFTGKHKKEKKETLVHWFSCKFYKIYNKSFFSQTFFLQWLLLCMSYPILCLFSHNLSRPLTGCLPFYFPVETL